MRALERHGKGRIDLRGFPRLTSLTRQSDIGSERLSAGFARCHFRKGDVAPQSKSGGGKPPPNDDLLTGWLVGSANLRRVLPNSLDFIHSEETLHLDVLNRTG
jgi:hypothetical protein